MIFGLGPKLEQWRLGNFEHDKEGGKERGHNQVICLVLRSRWGGRALFMFPGLEFYCFCAGKCNPARLTQGYSIISVHLIEGAYYAVVSGGNVKSRLEVWLRALGEEGRQ